MGVLFNKTRKREGSKMGEHNFSNFFLYANREEETTFSPAEYYLYKALPKSVNPASPGKPG